MALRGVLFDKDGTLIDCDATWAPVIRHLAVELAPEGVPDRLVEAAGLDIATGRLRAGSPWAAGTTLDLVRLWWPDADAGQRAALCRRIDAICAERATLGSVPLFDLPALFDALIARGLEVGIATNDSDLSLRAVVGRLGLAGRIAHLYGYDSVGRPKPAPDMVHAFCAATGLAPAEVAVVGDNTHDLEMARAAGAGWAIGVLSGNGLAADLEPFADVVLDSALDIAAWLDETAVAV